MKTASIKVDVLNLDRVRPLVEALQHYADEASWELEDDPGPEVSTAYYALWRYHGDGTSTPPWETARAALAAALETAGGQGGATE